MSLREKQSIFLKNVAKLILWAFKNGYELTGGELLRTVDQQRLYFEGYTVLKIGGQLKLAQTKKLSDTMQGKHLEKLAMDLNLFINGEHRTDKESFKPLAEYWHSLHQDNVSGYDWGWDLGHFQMN